MSVDVGSRLTRCLMDWILMLFSGEMDEIMEGREEGAIGPLRMRFGLRDGHGKAVAPVDDRQWLSLGCHWDVNGMPVVAKPGRPAWHQPVTIQGDQASIPKWQETRGCRAEHGSGGQRWAVVESSRRRLWEVA
jgi:hypothetical protein